MTWAPHVTATALLLPVAGLLAAADAVPALPDGPDLTLVKRVCTGCHALDTVTAMRHSPDEWDAEVAKMVDRGAPATEAEQAQISAYLAKNLPTKPAP